MQCVNKMTFLKSVACLGILFAAYAYWLYFLTTQFKSDIHFPKDLNDLKQISATLEKSQNENSVLVFILICSAYVYKQMFAIPGSFFSNILAGAIYGTWYGVALVCILTPVGATLCYLLSKYLARDLVVHRFPNRIATLQQLVNENKDSIFFFLLSARLFPGCPNWLLNICSPIVGIPVVPFFFSVLFGLMPYNFICVHTGAVLSSIKSVEEIFSFSTFFGLFLIAAVAALPGIILRRRKKP